MSNANIVEALARTAARCPEQPAVRDVDTAEAWTYGELAERVASTAEAYVARGLHPGDRVALLLTNGPRYIEHFLGSIAAGLVAVPLNVRLTVDDFRHMSLDSGATVLVTESRFAEVAAELRPLVREVVDVDDGPSASAGTPLDVIERSPDDLCTLMYTSGTTGSPKAVMLSHGAWAAVSETSAELLDFADAPSVLHVAPLTHGAGFMLLPTLAAGGLNLTTRAYDPERTAALLAGGGVDGLFLVPSMIRMLLDAVPPDWKPHPDLRWLYYAGSPITVETFVEATEVLDGRLVQSFAQMEAPMYLTALGSADHLAALEPEHRVLASTAGRVIPGRRVEIVDNDGRRVPVGAVGEIVAQAPQLMSGYWNRPDATAEAVREGWLHTGDLGRLDADGLLHVVDRVKDMIVTGGSNVYAREVEDVLIELPGVAQVAVVGLPHRVWGEEVTAVVVAEPGERFDEDEIRSRCRARLAGYKVPKRVVRVDSLPRNAYGKVLKRELKGLLSEVP